MRAFDKKSDLKEINDWLMERKIRKTVLPEDIPEIGFIEPGIAVGFLVQAECGVCFLDGYVTNPTALKELRSQALDLITDTLISRARLLKFQRIMALTKQPAIFIRATEHGFQSDPDVCYLSREVD